MPETPSSHQRSFWLREHPLLLASASATRLGMLTRCGMPVDVEPARIDERALEAAQILTAASTAIALATAKALEVSSRFSERLVLGADQTLYCEDTAYHKPASFEAAHRQLSQLAGREHLLTSGFCLAQNGRIVADGAASARMFMRRIDPASITRYLYAAGDAALASVGCYQLEGLGSQLFDSIEGDHFTILGLPLLQVLAALRRIGAVAE